MTFEPLKFSEDIDNDLNALLKIVRPTNIAILMDENTKKHCLPLLTNLHEIENQIVIIPGEAQKSLQTCYDVWQKMTDFNLDRKSLLINLGGGVVTDLGGFCASTFKRGIQFVHCPTTLMAQVDASIGGKTGIDYNGFKNLIGTFANPLQIIISPEFLNTLDYSQILSGYAEIIKHLLIREIPIEKIETLDLSRPPAAETIRESALIKQSIVSVDPKESHLRKSLNLGHTIGHAVEAAFLATKPEEAISHGEAVVLGLICELIIAKEKLGFSNDSFNRLVKKLSQFYPKLDLSWLSKDYFETFLRQDKKNVHDSIKLVCLDRYNKITIDVDATSNECWNALKAYNVLDWSI